MADLVTERESADSVELFQRFELKFFIAPQNLSFAHSLLRQICRPDGQYAGGWVHSLYFDTPDLEQYTRSASGEFKKDKVRIRWYNQGEDKNEIVSVFLELKSRQGFASSKQRKLFSVTKHSVLKPNLRAGILAKKELMDILAGFGHYPELPLRPIVVISYWRYRFNEILTGTRISFDCNIRSTMVAPELGYHNTEKRISGGVIEVKGSTLELPPTLRRIKLLDVSWSRFSKYVNCIDSHVVFPGVPV